MLEKQNFLDVLGQRIEEMKEQGLITEEQLDQGISIDSNWLFSESIKVNIIREIQTSLKI